MEGTSTTPEVGFGLGDGDGRRRVLYEVVCYCYDFVGVVGGVGVGVAQEPQADLPRVPQMLPYLSAVGAPMKATSVWTSPAGPRRGTPSVASEDYGYLHAAFGDELAYGAVD